MVTWGRRISQLFQLETRGWRSEVNKRTVIVMDTPLCFPPQASTKRNTAKRSASNRGSREAQAVATKVWCGGGGGCWKYKIYAVHFLLDPFYFHEMDEMGKDEAYHVTFENWNTSQFGFWPEYSVSLSIFLCSDFWGSRLWTRQVFATFCSNGNL